MPRAQKQSQKPRHDPLFVQLNEDEVEAKYGRISQPGKRNKSRKTDDDDAGDVPPFLSAHCSPLIRVHSLGHPRSQDISQNFRARPGSTG